MKTIDLLMAKARRSIVAAERHLEEGDNDFAASRTYYAYFYIAEALLLTRGLRFSRHGQVLAQFGLHFSKTKLLDPAFHRLLDRAFEFRQIGDYQTIPIAPDAIQELIAGGRSFLAAASQYLEKLPGAEGGEVDQG
jgi:uncharacterized protein (UPF0332 family)